MTRHRHDRKCTTPYCRNTAEGKHCSTCRSRKARRADPVKYAFTNLKGNAKRRGILFTLTLEQFREWCHQVNYVGLKGRSANSYTVDRIFEEVGYHADNIRLLTNRNNVKKYFSYDWRTKRVYELKMETVKEEMPF